MTRRTNRAIALLVCLCVFASIAVAWAAPNAGPSATVGSTCVGGADGSWIYHGTVTAREGLVLDQVRLGPRVFLQRLSVPYFYWNYLGSHPTQLTTTAADASPGMGSTTLESVVCDSTDTTARAVVNGSTVPYGDDFDSHVHAIRARYRVNGTPLGVTIHIYENFVFTDPLPGDRCEPSGEVLCARFWPNLAYDVDYDRTVAQSLGRANQVGGVRMIQRFDFAPDGTMPGAVNVFRDTHHGVDTQPDKNETSGNFIVNGKRLGACDNTSCTWDNYHQSGRDVVNGPGYVPPTAGCLDCAHWHFAWDGAVNDAAAHFTDGSPEILDASHQTVKFARVVAHDSEIDPSPSNGGYEQLLLGAGPKKDKPEKLADQHAILYVDSSSPGIAGYAGHVSGDSFSPELDNERHGGNGSIWFAPAATHQDGDCLKFTTGIAKQTSINPPRWTLPVVIAQDPRSSTCRNSFNIAQGPYYVLSPNAPILNADSVYTANPIGAPFTRITQSVTTKTKSVSGSLVFSAAPDLSTLDGIQLLAAPSLLPYTPYLGGDDRSCVVPGTTTSLAASIVSSQTSCVNSLTISTVDDGGTPLAGAAVSVYYDVQNDGVYETHVGDFTSSTAPQVFTNLQPGNYEVIETAAPSLFFGPAPLFVTVSTSTAALVTLRNQSVCPNGC